MLCPECPQCGYSRTGIEPGRPCAECGLDIPVGSVVVVGNWGKTTRFSPWLLSHAWAILVPSSVTAYFLIMPPSSAGLRAAFGVCFAATLIIVIYSIFIEPMRPRRITLFANPRGVSITRRRTAPAFVPWSAFSIVMLHDVIDSQFRRKHSNRLLLWRLTFSNPSVHPDWIDIKTKRDYRFVELAFNAREAEAHAYHKAIEELWIAGR
ncbi:MAG: hypothetical protein KC983_05040, partial [Phycisphaerales bacterium]|nr:hypothetical protein [Phycisphaerales bacterium]